MYCNHPSQDLSSCTVGQDSILPDFVNPYMAWFSVSFFCESPIVLHGVVQSDIFDDRSKTAHMDKKF